MGGGAGGRGGGHRLERVRQKANAETASPRPAEYKVRLQTTKGDVVILVHRDWSPIGADHFYELVKTGFYNDNRVFPDCAGLHRAMGNERRSKAEQRRGARSRFRTIRRR